MDYCQTQIVCETKLADEVVPGNIVYRCSTTGPDWEPWLVLESKPLYNIGEVDNYYFQAELFHQKKIKAWGLLYLALGTDFGTRELVGYTPKSIVSVLRTNP